MKIININVFIMSDQKLTSLNLKQQRIKVKWKKNKAWH